MDSRKVLLLIALVALVASASAATCQNYNAKQAGARCNQGETCCVGPDLWCDMGKCSLRKVGDDEKLRQCKVQAPNAGDRCDINNGMCCGNGMRCNVGRCSK
jgi:hypothetical protein